MLWSCCISFQSSYVFQRRPLTPPRFIKQEQYSKELSQQVGKILQLLKKLDMDQVDSLVNQFKKKKFGW